MNNLLKKIKEKIECFFIIMTIVMMYIYIFVSWLFSIVATLGITYIIGSTFIFFYINYEEYTCYHRFF